MKNCTKEKLGISLLVLVITIIVIIILAGAVILNLTKNNPIDNARKASYLNDLDSFKSELLMYETNMSASTLGEFDATKIQANDTSVTYTGPGTLDTTGKTIKDIISGLDSNKYKNEFEILDGELTYKGTDVKKQDWTLQLGLKVNNDKTNVIIGTSEILPVKAGTFVTYNISVFSNVGIKDIGDLTGKIVVTDTNGTEIVTQPTITVGTVISTTNEKDIPIIINTTGVFDGDYKIKLLADAVENNANLKNTETLSINSFTVDSKAPDVPVLTPSTTAWTNGSVTVSITYPSDAEKKEYSLDGTTWNNYTVGLIVNTNNTVIYARTIDLANNVSTESTLTIDNIDKINPEVTFGKNGGINVQTASTTVMISDVGGSAVNASTLQYVWDTQNTITPTNGWTTFTNGDTLTKQILVGSYYLWVKASDNAGNTIINKSNVFILNNEFTLNYTGSVQVVTLQPGNYIFECWGAQGGKYASLNTNTNGGYTKGTITLTTNRTFYIYVGESGKYGINTASYDVAPSWNGGGGGGRGSTYIDGTHYVQGCSGGGASDIRLVSGDWNDTNSLISRVMIAAGGGGTGSVAKDTDSIAGGGLNGLGENVNNVFAETYYDATGGTQTAGGTKGSSTYSTNGYNGSFGIGANGGGFQEVRMYGSGGGGGRRWILWRRRRCYFCI